MKCPYIVNTQTIIQTKVEQDEESENKCFFEVQNQRSEMIECIKTNVQFISTENAITTEIIKE